MKIPRTLLRFLGGLALASALSVSGAVTAPDNGDIFLGVRASGGQGSGVSLLINLGDDTAFRNVTAGSTLALSSFNAELTAAFGANWAQRSDVLWGIFGARNQTNPVVYGSRPQSPVGFPAQAYAAQDLSQRTATKNQVISVLDAYTLLDPYSGNANAALQTNALNSGSYSFQVGAAGTTDFGSLSQWTTIEGDFSAGASGTVLDLFRYAGTTTVPATERLGSLEITASGALSFTRSLPAGTAGIKLASATYAVDEDYGTVALVFRRTDDVSAAVSATFSTTNGSAIAGTDYTAQTNVSVSFGINEFEKTITVPISDRAGISASRDFTVTLTNPSSGAQLVSPTSATVTIQDTDSEVQFASATAQARALDVLGQPNVIDLNVNRSGFLGTAAAVEVNITGGTLATGGYHGFTSPTTVNFQAEDSSETISIPLNAIPLNLLPGTLVVTLSSPSGVSLGTTSAITLTVLPNSGELAFANATENVNAVNGSGSPSLLTVNLTRTGGTVGATSVQVAVTGGTLTSGVHFTPFASPTTVSFANGVSTGSFTLQLLGIPSTLLNSGATLVLTLSNPTNSATLGTTFTTTLTVVGTPGSIRFAAANFNVAEEIGSFQLPLVRTGGTSGAVSVRVSTTVGSATAPADFTALSNVLVNFADGATTALVPITIANTVANEPNETFTVTLSTPQGGATVVAPSTATVRILDVDTAAPGLTLTSPRSGSRIAAPNSTVNITGTATDNKEVASIRLQLNGAAAVNVPFTVDSRGAAAFNLPVTALRGTNIAVLQAFDHRGNASGILTTSFVYDDPFAALAGSYTGLAIASGATAPSHSTNGLVNVQVQPTGTFTGRLTIDGIALSFNGFIGTGGTARFGSLGADKIRVERPNKPAFEIAFALDLSTGPGVKRITGTVREFRRSRVVGTAALTAERAGFSRTVSVPAGYLVNKGAYTLVLPRQEQSEAFTTQDYPQGDGVGIATVTSDGTVRFAGTLADGTKFTASSLLWADLRLPLYTELYAKAGSLGGILSFNDALASSDFSGDDLFWFRPFQNVQHYPYGWPEGLDAIVRGAKYAVGSTSSLGSLPAVNPTLGNALLEFTDGLLASDLTKAVNLDAKDKATNAPVGDRSFSLTVTQATGLFAGKVNHTGTAQSDFTGVIYQKGPQRGGYGHFLSPTPRVRDGTGEAGAVTLSPRP